MTPCGKPGREIGPAAGVRYSFCSKPATAKPGHRMDGRAGKHGAVACGFSVDPDRVDVVLGVAILPYCNVPA
jgi:hypothetical protein